MDLTDFDEFAIIIAGMAATFRQEATEALLTGYRMGLGDLTIDDIRAAAARAMRSSRFLPTVAELRELAGEASPKHRAVLAWEAFQKALQFVGVYESVDFDDPIINATIRSLGGWPGIDERIGADGVKWVRKDFERIYETLATTGISEEAGLFLEGLHDQANRQNGHASAVKPPARIATGLPAHRPGLIHKGTPLTQRLLKGPGE